MDNQLKFRETLTVEQFKAAQHVDKIQVKQNPKTNKLFFTFGAKTGAVAGKGIPALPIVSNGEAPDGSSFWLPDLRAQVFRAEEWCKQYALPDMAGMESDRTGIQYGYKFKPIE